ncbi:exo-alpha-sialidase [Planctomycetota bacterium]
MTLGCVRNATMVSHILLLILASVAYGETIRAIRQGERLGPVALETLEGHRFTLDNYDSRTGTVVLFLSSRCDETEAQIDRINNLYEKYRHRGILWVGIGSNTAEENAELRRYSQARGVRFPIYRDPDKLVQQKLGPKVTPEVFLMNRDSKVVYTGAVGWAGDKGIEAAIQALRAHRPIELSSMAAQGTAVHETGVPRSLTDPHGYVSFSSELIFEQIPGAPAHHCSTICQAPNGDLLCVWYGGSYESSEDQALFMARRRLGQRQWDEPAVVIRNPGMPPGNAVVFSDAIGKIWLAWGRMESPRPIRRGGGWGECRLMCRVSNDNGLTWSADKPMIEGGFLLPRNQPIMLRFGTLALPISGRLNDEKGAFILMTDDHGMKWKSSGPMKGGSQPTIIERNDGSIFAMLRAQPRSKQCISFDQGKTWSAAVDSPLKNPGAGVAMAKLKNGHVIIVFNDSETNRTPLCIARSLDDGVTWEKPIPLEAAPGNYAYPCVMQTSDGKIHMTYTFRRYSIKHVEINEQWLYSFKRPG